MDTTFWTWLLTVLGSVATMGFALAVPAIREAVGKYVARFVQHQFDERIEKLKSELRRSEERFAADLRAKDQQLRSLADTTLALRSSRQVALDARRLQAIEKLWAAKIATDRLKLAANMASALNWEELFKSSEAGDPKIKGFAEMLDKMTGIDLVKEAPLMSALPERPFVPPKVWALFSAYQGVMSHSVVNLKILAAGTTKYMKKEDLLKPLMLLALPEYKSYIEEYGFSGYYHLLDVLEQKLLNAITEALEGKELDDVALKRNAEIISAVQALNAEKQPEIPESLKGPEIPEPPKK